MQERINIDLAICDITIDNAWWMLYILPKLTNNDAWQNFVSTLKLTEMADVVVNITSHLHSFEPTVCRTKGLSLDATLFVTKKGPWPIFNIEGRR